MSLEDLLIGQLRTCNTLSFIYSVAVPFLSRCHTECRSDSYNNIFEKPKRISVDKKQVNI